MLNATLVKIVFFIEQHFFFYGVAVVRWHATGPCAVFLRLIRFVIEPSLGRSFVRFMVVDSVTIFAMIVWCLAHSSPVFLRQCMRGRMTKTSVQIDIVTGSPRDSRNDRPGHDLHKAKGHSCPRGAAGIHGHGLFTVRKKWGKTQSQRSVRQPKSQCVSRGHRANELGLGFVHLLGRREQQTVFRDATWHMRFSFYKGWHLP